MSKGPKRQEKSGAKRKPAWTTKRPAPPRTPIECREKIACKGTMVEWEKGAEANIGVCDPCLTKLWAAFWRTMGIPAHKAPRRPASGTITGMTKL